MLSQTREIYPMSMCKKRTTAVSVYPDSDSEQHRYEYLAESSPKDKPWDDHRAFADLFTDALTHAGLPRYAGRVAGCAQALLFDLLADAATGEIAFKLKTAFFCHFRHCPICQWRRSMRNKALFLQRISEIEEAYPKARWLMLTLTVRNCCLSDLRDTIQSMNKAWGRLVKREEFRQVQGWVRSVEVTRGADGSAHPHYHALLMVPPSYFSGKGYIKTAQWARVWGECLRVDYVPVTDARAVKPKMVKGEDGQLIQSKSPLAAAAAEVLKYSTKGQDLLDGGPEWLAEFIAQVQGLKFLTSGGALKGIFSDRNDESDEELIHVEGEGVDDDNAKPDLRLSFNWRQSAKRYARKPGDLSTG